MPSFQRILAATDQSPQATKAVAEATRLALSLRAALTVLTVVETTIPPAEPNNVWDSGEDTEQRLRRAISELVEQSAGGIAQSVDIRVKWGSPDNAILTEAADLASDLIVLGVRGAGGATATGHVAAAVVAAASCPVMLIGGGQAPAPAVSTQGSALTVEHVMHSPVVSISPEETLASAKRTMLQAGIHQLPVVASETLIGIVSRRDIAPHEGYLERTKVDAVMTHGPVTVAPNDPLAKAAKLLLEQNVNALPVVDSVHAVGIVSKTDVLRYVIRLLDADGSR